MASPFDTQQTAETISARYDLVDALNSKANPRGVEDYFAEKAAKRYARRLAKVQVYLAKRAAR